MCSFEQRRERIRGAVRTFQRFPGDTGSSEVQGNRGCCRGRELAVTCGQVLMEQHATRAVGILTEKILCMAEHMRAHRKDFSSRE